MSKNYDNLIKNIETRDALNLAIQKELSQKSRLDDVIKANGYSAYGSNSEKKAIHDQARLDLNATNQKIDVLTFELSECKPVATIDTVLEHQSIVNTVQAEIDRYQALINEQQTIINLASEHNDLLSPLIEQREELLTDIALGNNKAGALKKLDAQIESVKEDQSTLLDDNQQTIIQSQQTINGLNKRVNESQKRLSCLQLLSSKILDCFLLEQAEKTAIELNMLAGSFIEKLKQLVAFDVVIAEYGQRKNTGLLYESWLVKIPWVGYEKTPASIQFDAHYLLDTTQDLKHSRDLINQVDYLKQGLIQQGVVIEQLAVKS